MMGPDLDLFGHFVVRCARARGRPCHAPTVELRSLVRSMRSAGAYQPEIAASLRITLPTLRRHYRAELGPARHTFNKEKTDG